MTREQQYKGIEKLLNSVNISSGIMFTEQYKKELSEILTEVLKTLKSEDTVPNIPNDMTEISEGLSRGQAHTENNGMSETAILEELTHRLDAPATIQKVISEMIGNDLDLHLQKPQMTDEEFLNYIERRLKIEKWIPERYLYAWMCHRKQIAPSMHDYEVKCHRRILQYMTQVRENERITYTLLNILTNKLSKDQLRYPPYTITIKANGVFVFETKYEVHKLLDYLSVSENKQILETLNKTLSILCQVNNLETPIDVAEALNGIVSQYLKTGYPPILTERDTK